MPASLEISLGPLSLSNPVMVASGTYGGVYEQVFDPNRLGAVVLKTVTLNPRTGNPTPRVCETASGMLNSIGLENPGIDAFLADELPKSASLKTKVVASIAGKDADEFGALAARIGEGERIDAVELNLSCPNVSGGLDFATDPKSTEKVVSLCRAQVKVPLIAKLTPNTTDVAGIARAAAAGGADIISLINTLKAMAVDWRARKPFLGAGMGGLSGPAIKPVALRMVWEVARALPKVPVIGIGGIASAEDVMEFLCAGASAVQVGTANFVDPEACVKIIDQLPALLEEAGAGSVSELVGSLKR